MANNVNNLLFLSFLAAAVPTNAFGYNYNGQNLYLRGCREFVDPDFGYGHVGIYQTPSLREVEIFFPSPEYQTCPY